MDIKSHYIKLTGKAELPKALDMDKNYHVSLSGDIRSVADFNNDDGTKNRQYTFKPIKIELLDELGETMKAKDTRSNSQLLRALLWKKWVNAASDIPFEEFYQKFTYGAMGDIDMLIDRYVK